MLKVHFPLKVNDEELILVKNKRTGKILWWNKTKGMFAVINTPFMNWLKQKAQEKQ